MCYSILWADNYFYCSTRNRTFSCKMQSNYCPQLFGMVNNCGDSVLNSPWEIDLSPSPRKNWSVYTWFNSFIPRSFKNLEIWSTMFPKHTDYLQKFGPAVFERQQSTSAPWSASFKPPVCAWGSAFKKSGILISSDFCATLHSFLFYDPLDMDAFKS